MKQTILSTIIIALFLTSAFVFGSIGSFGLQSAGFSAATFKFDFEAESINGRKRTKMEYAYHCIHLAERQR